MDAKIYKKIINKKATPKDLDKKEEKISKKIAAAEVIKIRRTEQKLYVAGAIIPLIIYGINILSPGISPVIAIASAGLFGWFYMNTTKELERLTVKYGL